MNWLVPNDMMAVFHLPRLEFGNKRVVPMDLRWLDPRQWWVNINCHVRESHENMSSCQITLNPPCWNRHHHWGLIQMRTSVTFYELLLQRMVTVTHQYWKAYRDIQASACVHHWCCNCAERPYYSVWACTDADFLVRFTHKPNVRSDFTTSSQRIS